jgi:hypothetical protein
VDTGMCPEISARMMTVLFRSLGELRITVRTPCDKQFRRRRSFAFTLRPAMQAAHWRIDWSVTRRPASFSREPMLAPRDPGVTPPCIPGTGHSYMLLISIDVMRTVGRSPRNC